MILAFDIKKEFLKNPSEFPRALFKSGIEENILIRPIGSTVYVMPPYILHSQETMDMGSSIQKALNKAIASL